MDANSQQTDGPITSHSAMAASDENKTSQSTNVKEIGETVLRAVHELRDKNGCRLRDIKKFLSQQHGIDVEKNLPQVKFFLNKFQKDGRLIKDAEGKYKDVASRRRRKRSSKAPSSGGKRRRRRRSGGKKSKGAKKSRRKRRSGGGKKSKRASKGRRRKRSKKAANADQSA